MVGPAGSGKSTFLRYLAWKLAADEDRFPILIKVVELDRTIDHLLGNASAKPSDHRWLAIHAAGKRWEQDEDFFHRQLQRSGTIVLLDGFDEATSDDHRRRLAALLPIARKQYPDCHFVLTSRPGVYEGDRRMEGFVVSPLAPMTKESRAIFFRKWCECAYPDNPVEREKQQESLVRQVEGNPNVELLADSPMMLTALAGIHWNGKTLPEDRGELYDSIIGWMIASRPRDTVDGRHRVPAGQCRKLLQALAFGMQTREGGRLKQADESTAKEILCDLAKLGPADASQFLKQEQLDSGIITGSGKEMVEFRHLTFQEHLAGVELLDNRLEADQENLLANPRRYAAEWAEFLSLFAIQAGERKAQWVYAKLLGAATYESLANKARTVSMIRGMVRHRRERETDIESPLYMEFVRAMSGLFQGKADGENLDPFARADAAEAWELLVGDTSRLRLPSDHEYWAPIAGGKGLGRNPVTVHEYAHYLTRNKSAAEPENWTEQEVFPHRPVVYVSFHDAVAYCKWWSAETGKAIRLPKAAEWKKAPAGEYPWGDELPNYDRANYDWKIKRPTPVGLFPKGNVPNTQIADMAGNVLEWTHNKVVRGGSFDDGYSWDLQAAVRGYDGPDGRSDDLGFRCLREVFP